MNLSELRERVKVLLRDVVIDPAEESNLISNAELNSIINERRGELHAHLVTLFPARFIDSTTMTYSSGASAETLPVAAQHTKVMSVRMRTYNQTAPYEYRTLKVVSITEAMGFEAAGIPIIASIQGMTKIRLRPVPDVAYTLELFYAPSLTDLGDADSPTEIPPQFHHVLAYAAAVRVKQMVDDPPGQLDMAHQEALSRLVAFIGAVADDHGLEGLGY